MLCSREPLRELVHPVQPEEEVAPGKPFRVGRQRQVALVDAFGVKLVQVDRSTGRVGLKWLMMASGTSMERLQVLISLKFT